LKVAAPSALAALPVVPHYQPVIDLDSGQVVGVEALMRLRRGDDLLPPADFLPAAIRSGDVLHLGRRLTRAAVACAARWLGAGAGDVQLLINMSASEIAAPGQVAFLHELLADHEVRPQTLTIEITESMPLDHLTRPLRELSRLGIGLALDDFGTGFGALQHLRDLPLTGVKIDGKFISGPGSKRVRAFDDAVVAAIASLAAARRIWCIAEGVESRVQHEKLRDQGLTFGQGYFYSHPLPEDELIARFWSSASA
jgi:EAL domain-containing protein (putative c-di-GMP-specific phosphodiesterase class I)